MTTIAALAERMNAAAGGSATTKNEAGSQDRFLKLLVAQMQNQDPMNPLDNAQVTSQMAQISTVDGIATLVGRDVTVAGNRLSVQGGVGVGGFELTSAADQVKVEILNAAGHVVGSVPLGAASAGRHAFEWPAGKVADGDGYRFRVSATQGSSSVLGESLMRDRVDAVSHGANQVNLELRHSGAVGYDTVKAFN